MNLTAQEYLTYLEGWSTEELRTIYGAGGGRLGRGMLILQLVEAKFGRGALNMPADRK